MFQIIAWKRQQRSIQARQMWGKAKTYFKADIWCHQNGLRLVALHERKSSSKVKIHFKMHLKKSELKMKYKTSSFQHYKYLNVRKVQKNICLNIYEHRISSGTPGRFEYEH